MPEVSVIIGTYNGESRISKTIDSILNQTFQDFELIICDDASTDQTVDVIEKYIENDPRIILIKNSTNQKLSITLNHCLSIAKGEFIVRIDDDDIAHKDRIQYQIDFMKKHPEYVVLGTSRNLFDQNGIWGCDIRPEGEITVIDIALGKSFIHPSVMMRKKVLDEVNGYTVGKNVERTEDLDLWYKILSQGYKGFSTNRVLLDYYEDLSSYGRRKYKYRICEYKVRNYYCNKLHLPFKCKLYAYRPLLVGLLPRKFLYSKHIDKYFNKTTIN